MTSGEAKVKKDECVVIPTTDNLDEVIAANEVVLVELYPPRCGQCKALAPKYAKANGTPVEKDPPIVLGKLDAAGPSPCSPRSATISTRRILTQSSGTTASPTGWPTSWQSPRRNSTIMY